MQLNLKVTSLMLGFCLLTVGGCSYNSQVLSQAQPESEPSQLEEDASAALEIPGTASSEFALNQDELGRALRGYDPVSYFVTGKAVPGEEAYQLKWQGVVWLFSSAENRDTFAAEPEAYAPENGGYCTFGIVLSKKFDGDPHVWLIQDNKLYVFLNPEVKETFLQDESGNFERVTTNWPIIRDKSPQAL